MCFREKGSAGTRVFFSRIGDFHIQDVNPNVAKSFGPEPLRSLYIRPLCNMHSFLRLHRMFNMFFHP